MRLGTCPRTNRWTRTYERYAWSSRGAMRLDRNTVPRFGLRGVSSTADGPYQILKLAGVCLSLKTTLVESLSMYLKPQPLVQEEVVGCTGTRY